MSTAIKKLWFDDEIEYLEQLCFNAKSRYVVRFSVKQLYAVTCIIAHL